MRRLFCAQRVSTNSSETPAARLCLGAPGAAGAAVYEGSSVSSSYGTTVPSQLLSGGGIAGSGGGGRGRRPLYLVRQTTVVKIMVGLLALAALVGWKARHLLQSKRQGEGGGQAPAVAMHAVEEGVVVNGVAARRRSHLNKTKRARV